MNLMISKPAEYVSLSSKLQGIAKEIALIYILFFVSVSFFAAINPDETAVRNLSASTFILSPTGDSLALNISWQEPSFNFSVLYDYQIIYTIGRNNKSVENTVSLSVNYFLVVLNA